MNQLCWNTNTSKTGRTPALEGPKLKLLCRADTAHDPGGGSITCEDACLYHSGKVVRDAWRMDGAR